MTLHLMTFHESYGELPKGLLGLYKQHNVSPADHDSILAVFNFRWDDVDIPWQAVLEFTLAHIDNGTFRLPLYL